MTAKQRSNGKR